MPKIICNTSPLQYLYQLGLLDIIPKLSKPVLVPPAVVEEIERGRGYGISLPDINALDWIEVKSPDSRIASSLITDIGPGETEVLLMGLEIPDAVVVIDDLLARRIAENLKLKLTGTLGLLIDAKKMGAIPAVKPLLQQLESLRFRIASQTKNAVLKIAGE